MRPKDQFSAAFRTSRKHGARLCAPQSTKSSGGCPERPSGAFFEAPATNASAGHTCRPPQRPTLRRLSAAGNNGAVTRTRRFFDGTGPYPGLAIGCFVVGFLLLLSILLSPHGWQWWLDAKAVQGHEQNGIVSYSFAGQTWTIDDSGSASASRPRTVYVIAADPAHGELTNTSTVILDWTATCAPAAVGVGLVAVGFRRRSRLRRRQLSSDPTSAGHGQGIPSEVIKNITSENRG